MAFDYQKTGRGELGVWVDAAKVKPEPYDPEDGLTRVVLCVGNKGSYFLARYMYYAETWFTDLACKNRRHVEAWTDLPPRPERKDLILSRGGLRSLKLDEMTMVDKKKLLGKPVYYKGRYK